METQVLPPAPPAPPSVASFLGWADWDNYEPEPVKLCKVNDPDCEACQ